MCIRDRCAPDAAFSLATEVLQHLNRCFAEELSLTELTNRFHVSTSHMIHMFKAQFGLPPIQYMAVSYTHLDVYKRQPEVWDLTRASAVMEAT